MWLKRTLLALSIALVLAVVWFGGSISYPRTSVNQWHALDNIRDVNAGQQKYAEQHPDAGFACSLSELGERDFDSSSKGGYISSLMASGTVSGYRFEVKCAESAGQKATAYTITAVPMKPGITGINAYCSDQSGEIWYSKLNSASDCLAKRIPIEKKYRE